MNPYFLKAENCMFGGKGFRYPLQLAVTLMFWKMSLYRGRQCFWVAKAGFLWREVVRIEPRVGQRKGWGGIEMPQ